MSDNPLIPFLERQGVIVLDGGLATALEARGHDLADELWSARVLLEAPDAIRDVHRAFLDAGADVIVSATYQATVSGFRRRGLSSTAAEELFRLAIDLAVETRDAFWAEPDNRRDRLRPLVAASVGPYGAALTDGSEYSGDYGIPDEELYAFHRDRWHLLASGPADLLACETIPARNEAAVLLRLMRETPDRWAWLSCSCRDGEHLSDGTPFRDVAAACDREPRVAAVGVNCTAPEFIAPLVRQGRAATGKPIVVYPNSGERYDVTGRRWTGTPSAPNWPRAAEEWIAAGAAGVGGCCRVEAAAISAIRHQVVA